MPNNNNRINFQVGYNVDQASVNAVKKSLQDLQNIKFKDFKGPRQDLEQIKRVAGQVQAALTKAFNVNLNSLNTQQFNASLKQAQLSIDKIYSSFSKAGAQGQVAFSRMASEVLTTNMQLKQTNSLVSQMGETMANTVKWGIASSVMNNFTNSVRQAFDYVKALDSSLNDIRIVTKQSSDEMANFAVQANNSAQALGRSTMDYTKAALTFYQQGLDEASVQARTESVLKAQNITGAGEEMADYLTAVWNGYKVANEEAELYVDKLAAVADSSASNMSQLAVAMSKVASSANLLGVPVDKLNAQIATITATTRQAPQSVGNALKTIYSRINDIATGADDAEISLGNYSSKMAEVGISVLDANGRLRDTGDVIDEIGGKWQTLSHEQQIYLARTMAGQRQYNNLLALFENWGKYSELVNVSMQAQGTTAQKNAIYLESLSAKMEQLGAAGERVKAALIDEDDLKGLVDFGTGIVNTFGTLIESIGGGKTAILALGSIFTQVFSGTITKQLNNIVTNFQNVKNNAQILKQSIASTELLGRSQGYQDGTIKEMVDAKKQIASYYSLISSQQLESYNSIVKEIGANKQEVIQLQKKVQLGRQYKQAIQQSAQKSGEDFDSKYYQASDAVEQLVASLDKFNTTKKAALDDHKGLDELESNFRDLTNIIGSQTIPNFEKIKNLFAEIRAGMLKGDEVSQPFRQLTQLLNQTTSGFVYAGQFDSLSNSLDIANAKLQESINRAKQFQAAMQQFSNIKGIVDTASAIGRLASGLNSIKNLGSIWTNENLSGGEKLLQTVTNLGMTIPMLVSAYKTLKTTTVALSQSMLGYNAVVQATSELETAQIAVKEAKKAVVEASNAVIKGQAGAQAALTAARAQQTAATNAATVAQQALNKAMATNPIGMIITGITLAVTAIYGLVKVYDHFTMSVKEADQAIDAFNEKQKQIASSNATLAQQTSTLESIKNQYEQLAEKAGAINFDSNIDNLTQAERSRYNQIKNIIAQYNDKAIAGYNAQGQAILANNTYIENQIQLLKDKRQAEIDAYVSSQDFKNADKGFQIKAEDALNKYQSFAASREDTEQQYQSLFDSLTDLNYGFGQYADKFGGILKSLYSLNIRINENGIQQLRKGLPILDKIENEVQNWAANEEADFLNTENIKETIQRLKYIANLQTQEDKLKQLADQAVKIPIDIILTKLSTSQFNEQYNILAQTYGQAMVNSLIRSYAEGINSGEGFTFGKNFGSTEAVKQINEEFLQTLLNLQLTDSEIKEVQQKNVKLLQSLNPEETTAEQYKKAIENLITQVTLGNQKLLKLAEQQPQVYNSLIKSIFGLSDFSAGVSNYYGLKKLFINNFSTSTLQAYRQARQEAYKKIKDLPVDGQQGLAKKFIDSANIWQIENFDAILQQYLKIPELTTNAWEIAVARVKNYQQVQKNIETVGLLSSLSSGDIDEEGFAQLTNRLDELVEKYPQISNQVKVLETDWMRSTSAYQDALRDVNTLLFETTQQAVQSGVMQKQQASASLKTLISDSETLQVALSKELLTIQDYQNTLGTLASQYESCKDQLNFYAQVLQTGTEQTIANAQATLQLSLRAAELGQITGISGDRIERVAALLAQENEVLQQNSQLAADAAVRYIRLNESIEDLYTNAQDYRQLLANIARDGQDAIYTNEDLFDSFNGLKEVVANVFDTSSDAFSDSWMLEHLEQIIQMAQQGGEGLEQLRAAAAEEILINTGIDMSGFYMDQEDFISQINALEQGADINCQANLDLLVFIQQLVTAMQQAGYAQGEIQSRLSGLNIDVDLAPYEAGLNTMIDEAMQAGSAAGQALSDSFASTGGVDVKTKTETQEVPQQTVVPGQTYNVGYQQGTYRYPIFSVGTAGGMPSFNVSEGSFTASVPVFLPVQKTETVEGSVKTAATALQVVGANKSSGGKISHYNSPGSRGARNPSKGKGGGGGGGGKKASPATQAKISTSKVTTKPKVSDYNPYQQEQKSFERQSKVLDELQNKQKKLVNKDRLKNLQEQNKVLEKQKDILQKELAISANEAAENSTANYANRLKQAFKNIGFDQDGQISDINAIQAENAKVYNQAAQTAADAFEKEKQNYNNYIQNVWNKYATKEQQQAHKGEKDLWDERVKNAQKAANDSIKAAEEVYKEREDLIKSYNDAWKDDQKRLEDYNQLTDQIYDNLIAISKIKVDLSIDTGDFERDWLDFENKFIKKLDKNDFLGSAKASAKELMSYFNSKQVQQTADQIKKIRDQIAIMNAGAVSSIYGTNLAQAKEDLEEYMNQQMDDLEEIQDMVDDIKDNYLDAIDNAKDKMDEQIDQYERVNDLIDHNVKMVELLYGDKAYDSMNKYYNLQKTNNERELESLKKQQDYWQSRMNNEVVGSEAWEKFKKNLDDVTDSLNDKLEDMIDNLAKQFENRVNGIIDRLNNALTGGRGLDFLDQQWDYISNYDNNFLDTFETKTGIEEVERLYQSEIDALAGSPKSQQKLNKLMNDQLKLLREKDHLTEYDLERAKASLEVEKARLALEEARDRKTKMRLRRDSQGNYTYQYVADEEKLGDLQAALADAQANLYNTDKQHYKQNLNTLYDTYKEYIEKMRDLTAEYNATQDEEERKRIQGRIDLLKESTAKLMSGLTEDNKYLLNYLNGSYFDGMGTDTSTLTMEEQMEIMKENIPYMQSQIQDLSDTIVGEGGILPATANMIKEINAATVEYDKNVKSTLATAGTSLQTIEQAINSEGNALDKNIINAQKLITANDELIKSCQAQIEAMEQLLDYMDKYLSKIMSVETLLNNLRSAYNTGQDLNSSNLTADNINMTNWGMDTTAGAEYTGNPATDAAAIKRQIDALMAQYQKFLQGMSIATFDTGGYTGSWADASGRLAFLHQGELVLNQDDTRNILSAVELVRSMASSINGFVSGELGSLMSGAVGLLSGISNTEQLDQNVHIEANFPNVTQHTEIEQAFENLVNMASMRASKYRD